MSKVLTGRRYRLEPTPTQVRELGRAVGAARWVWNWALAYRNDVWLAAKSAGATGIKGNLGYVHLCSLLPGLKRDYPWLEEVSSEVLRGALRNLDRAFTAFFAGTGAYPRFKKRGDHEAINFGDPAKFCVDGPWVKLPRLGWVRINLHRPLDGEARTAAVAREGRNWFVSFCVAGTFSLPTPKEAAVGIDLGVTKSAMLSTGESVSFPVMTAKEERRLAFFCRQASRRAKGSARRRRANERVAKIKRHIANRRKDAAHKLSTRLATTHTLIAVEDLKLKNMTASARGTVAEPGKNVAAKSGLNRVLLQQGHSDFRRMLTYKCERSGARLVAVNPAFTSQTCSRCQHCAPENRQSQAVFVCVACDLHINADLNAALNIQAAGLAASAQGGSGVALAGELRTHPKRRRSAPLRRKRSKIPTTSRESFR